MDDFDLEMDSHSPPITPAFNPAPLRPPSPRPSSSAKPSSFPQPQSGSSSNSSSSSVMPLGSSSSPASNPTATGAVRFPSSFADFKLPTSPVTQGGLQGSFSYGGESGPSSSVPLGFGALLANGGGPGAGYFGSVNGGLDPNSLAAKRARRGSLLSLNNHYRSAGGGGDSAMVDSIEQHRPTSPLSLSSSSATFQFGLPSSSSNSSTYSTSSLATARPSTPPLSSPWMSSLTRDGRPTSSSSSSSMMISPQTSAKVVTRPSSPVALLNPPSFREVMSSPKHEGTRFETGRMAGSGPMGVDQQLRDLEEQMEMGGRDGIVSRPITRTRNLKPQIKRTTTLLAAEAMPVDFYRAEASQEADWRRKTTSMPISPATLKIRSSLSGATASSSAANQHRLQAGRFPEDADVDDDLFANGMGGQSSGSSDDDDGMDDGNGTDGEGSVAGGSVTSTSIRERTSFGSLGNFGLGGGGPGGGHSSATPPPSFAVPVPAAAAGMFSGHRMSTANGMECGDASMVISSPVLGAAMASPAGTPGGMGWRDSGKAGNKRKAADDRFEPYTKRRAVSPSTVLFPNSNNNNPITTATASALPAHTYSSSSSSSSSMGGLASPIHAQPNLPSSNLSTSTTLSSSSTSTIPIPITNSPYYTTSRSRGGSPVPQMQMAFSNGTSAARSFGASSPFTGPGLGLSMLQREREGRRVAAAMEEEVGGGEGVLGKMRLE